ncbi:uncharacterized protein LOC143618767 [Bidens hawaiensis]|uniref:uncharacterized protein LOC143618767 n=1 Tax=Bidens hawaiensis TaxID=980011 RepID=UPI00404A6845
MPATTESAIKLAGYLMEKRGNFSAECTKKKPAVCGTSDSGAKNDGKKGNARAFMLNTQKAGELPDVITSTFPINNIYARVLFDSGANQSSIDYKFCNLLNEPLAKLNNYYEVETTNGNLTQISEILSSYISLAGYELSVHLLPMELAGFDLGIKKLVELESFTKKKASHYLGKGCLAFVAYVTTEPELKKKEEVPIVSEFKDVFPDEMPGVPPDREVKFRIDLIPGMAPIAKSPYRLAPTEMKELKKQLHELLEKGFI